jgi:hypothetical protein
MKRKGLFGKLVVGAERAAEERTFLEERRHKFGPLVLGDKGAKPGTNTPLPDSKPVTGGASAERIREILTANPAFLTTYVEQEFNRAKTGGVRRKVLSLFLEIAPKIYDESEQTKLKIRVDNFLKTGEDVEQVADLKKRPRKGPKLPERELKEIAEDPASPSELLRELAAAGSAEAPPADDGDDAGEETTDEDEE